MKTIAKITAMIFLLGAGIWLTAQTTQAHNRISVQIFYDDLRPYGTWVESPDYGFVWVPDVNPGFQPYGTSGYWTYTIYGWTWVSYYPWGWAPFHYGRWYYDNWYGWAWVPGYEWGPGWVTWSHCDGYFGWAPLMPGFHVSVNVNVNVRVPAPYWVFLPERHFGRRDMDRYYAGRLDNERLFHRATAMNGTIADRETNTRYYAGPEVREVRKVTGRDFKPVEVRETGKPGQVMRDGKMEVYRPVKKSDAPAKYNRAPAERQVQVNNGKGNEYIKGKPESKSQPVNRQYANPGSTERKIQPVQKQNSSPATFERKTQPTQTHYQGKSKSERQIQSAPKQNQSSGKPGTQVKPAEKKTSMAKSSSATERNSGKVQQKTGVGNQKKR